MDRGDGASGAAPTAGLASGGESALIIRYGAPEPTIFSGLYHLDLDLPAETFVRDVRRSPDASPPSGGVAADVRSENLAGLIASPGRMSLVRGVRCAARVEASRRAAGGSTMTVASTMIRAGPADASDDLPALGEAIATYLRAGRRTIN